MSGRASSHSVTFYLGTHRPHWLADSQVPLFVSRRTLEPYKTLPRATSPWVLDSGGFTELKRGSWSITRDQYAREVSHYAREIGNLAWAAPMDWMCEPEILLKTGLTLREHQRRTIENFRWLRHELGTVIVPVLQGWTIDDYLQHADDYYRFTDRFDDEPVVGVGSICRRGQDEEIHRIIRRLAAEGIQQHAFGVRSRALAGCADVLVSADSMAWSYRARKDAKEGTAPDHEHPRGGKTCANCRIYAERWYAKQIESLESTLFYGAAA